MTLKLNGSDDGSVSIDAPSDTSPSGSDITLTLPTTVGSAEQFLKNSGTAGELEFSSMVETSTGVGIGTSSPRGLIHLHSSSAPRLDFTNTTTGTGSGDGATFSVDGSTGALNIIQRESQPIQFYTSNDERLRIDDDGALMSAAGTSTASTNDNHHQFHTSFNNYGVRFKTHNTSQTADAIRGENNRSASSSFNLLRLYSGDGSTNGASDAEFRFRGDGSAYADGDWNTGGADYAEYFEWSDGNTSEEDRRGISVVLVDDKIREAVAGEDPIGVISGNPSVVGDSAWNKWSGKHLRDEYGSYVLDENGHRQLNPDYDPDVTYVPREDRAEWDCVGLMGKLRIRKGQVTGARWIKMRDVSDTIEEWLVR